MTDITEIKAKDGKLYVSAIFDCFDSAVLGLAMETTMKATFCQHTVENAFIAYPEIRGAVLHSDRGSQYTSELYRSTLRKYEIIQSMNSAGGRCHDNARCESMWARLKTELLYDRYNMSLRKMCQPSLLHLFEKNEKAAGAYLRQRPFCTIFKENSFRA